MRYAFLFSILSIFSFTIVAEGKSTVRTPFQLNLDKATLNSLIYERVVTPAVVGEQSIAIPDSSVGEPFSIAITGISLNIKYDFGKPVVDRLQQNWKFNSRQISAELVVQKIDASQVVEIEQDGILIKVRIDGSCSNVRLGLPEGNSAFHATVRSRILNGKPSFDLTELVADWKPEAWQVKSMNCQGPQGFDARIAAAATDRLRLVDPFLPSIRTQIQSALHAHDADPLSLQFQIPAENPNQAVSLTLDIGNLRDSGVAQVSIGGMASFDFLGLSAWSKCNALVSGLSPLPLVSSNELSLTLPFAAVPALLNCAQLDSALNYRFASTGIVAFRKLQHSFLEKLLIWPDLNHFNQDAVFYFLSRPQFPVLLEEARATSLHHFRVATSLPLTTEMLAPQDNSWVSYLHFFTKVLGPAEFTVENESVNIKMDTSAKFDFNYDWDPNYIDRYKPEQKICSSKLASAARDYLLGTGLTFALPRLHVSSLRSLSIESADVEGSNIKIVFLDR